MRRLGIACLAVASLSAAVHAQIITDTSPEVASPGTLVTVHGTGLGATTALEFTGVVGGFVGTWTVDLPVVSVSAGEASAPMPTINGWIPPWLGPEAGSPFGLVRAVSGASPGQNAALVPYYFLEGTGGLLVNAGAGSTQSNGARASISFDPGVPSPDPALGIPWKSVGTGAPAPGNSAFAMDLVDAVPGSVPFLVLGAPGTGLPIDDGSLALDPLGWFVALPAPVVGPAGTSSVPLPIPASAEGIGAVATQWVFLDGLTGALRISSGLAILYP